MIMDDDVEEIEGSLGERLGEWVVESISRLDIGSQVPMENGGCSVLESDSENRCCSVSDGGIGTLEVDGGITVEGCLMPVGGTDCDVVDDFGCDRVDANVEGREIGFDETQSNGMDSSHEGGDLSGVVPVDGAVTDCIVKNESDRVVGGDVPSMSCCVEVVSNGTFDRVVDDVPSKSLLIPDEVTLDVATDVIESSDLEHKEGKGDASIDNNICEFMCPDVSSLPLRRSSRSRKSIPKLQGEKRATNRTKKASKLSLGGNVDFFSNATRKKRSCISKSLCSSGWGPSANLSKYFELSNEAGINQVSNKGHKKGKATRNSKKKKEPIIVACLTAAGGGLEVARRPIRLKVTFGKREEKNKMEAIPLEIDASSSLPLGNNGHQLDMCSYIGSTRENVMENSGRKDTAILNRCSNSVENVQFSGTDLEICSILGKSTHIGPVPLESEKLSSFRVDKYVDPGTSPDSEVIDQILDSTTGMSISTVVPKPVNITSNGTVDPDNGSCQLKLKKNKKKRNKKDKVLQAGYPDMEEKLLCQTSGNKIKVSKGGKKQEKSVLCAADAAGATAPSENPSSNTCGSELISTDFLSNLNEGPHNGLENGVDSNTCSGIAFGVESADSGNFCQLLPLEESWEIRNASCCNAKGKSRNKSNVSDATRKKKDPSCQLKADKGKLPSKCKVNKNDISCEVYKGHEPETGKFFMVDVGKADTGNGLAPENLSCQVVIPTEVGEQMLPPPSIAWVCCDDCNKWRCISAELADIIEATNSRWTCKDNHDQAFADCLIPQEKSNGDINAELQISDEEDFRDGHFGYKSNGIKNVAGSQSSTWMLIKSNLYLHRSRKTQTVDEIMVCHCKSHADNGLGCGSQCLNRMLNIECVQGTCPCGDLCSNQRFQKHQYAKLSWFRCGKKGYGLQILEDISKGQFLIEYVGEVLDLQSYEARQQEYASKGHKHFYFMTLNGNEVIDASVKGNLGRFVNHSCDPNCRTEKWVVNGEICVGLFSLRSISKGEELTFDYNYVRVFGAAAKKCHCGSHKCRGYIGGDPRNAEVIVQGDSDEEFPEPVVVNQNGEIDHTIKNMVDKIKAEDVKLQPNEDNFCEERVNGMLEGGEVENVMKNSPIDDDGLLPTSTKDETDEAHESSDNLVASQTDDVKNGAVFSTKPHVSTTEQAIVTSTSSPLPNTILMKGMVKDSLCGSIDSSGRMSEVDNVECERPPSKARPRMKISRPYKSVKHRKPNSSLVSVERALVMTHRSQVLSNRPKKLLEGSSSCHLEAVEEKLNELLDADGGICKRKDASKGYLKLLLLTAASGDSCNGGAIQSNRDLSMILDAMLKSKSRGVLLDIINKNGLQMLHNMMKLYRKDFKKIPILRKLLKVLEFLAEKEILTVERINEDPIHPGVESFRESILSFTEHEDKKVHQIARHFRDRWIRRPMRKMNRMENGRRQELNRSSEFNRSFETNHHWRDHNARPTEPMDCSSQTVLSTDIKMQEASPPKICETQPVVARRRKRKSRWDQPADPVSPRHCKEPRIVPTSPQMIKTSPKSEFSQVLQETSTKVEDNDAPPGFSSLLSEDAPPGFSLQRSEDIPPGFSSSPSPQCSTPVETPTLCTGDLQERFNSHLPVAYGIPFPMMQQLGNLHLGTVDSWAIAPAMPFQPFPPLPPYPRNTRDFQQPCITGVARNEGFEEVKVDNHLNQGIPSTSGTNNHHMLPQERGFSNSFGRRSGWGFKGNYHRNKNWQRNRDHVDNRVPWLRKRLGWDYQENHPRNGGFNLPDDTISNEHNGQNLHDVNHSVDCAGNYC